MVYRYLALVLFLIFVLNSVISHSASHQVFKIDNSDTYLFYFEENNKYIVNKIEITQDKIQNITETKFFKNQKRALEYIKLQKDISSKEIAFSNIQTEVPGEVIWPTVNEWSWEWEQKYAEWIKENLTASFFVKYKIATDCADAAVALRWIFARINSLPAAQTLVVTHRIFSNESMKEEWLSLPTHENWFEDKRFLKALDFVLLNSYTHSLYADSYPIQINQDVLLMGTHFLKLRYEGGHTLVVSEYYKNKMLYTLNSDVPRKVRRLDRYGFWHSPQPKYGEIGGQGVGGFLRMRWPVRTEEGFDLKPKSEMPFYSLEQYADDFLTGKNNFSEEVHKRFGHVSTPLERYQEALLKVKTSFESRVSIVEEGFQFCSQNDCSFETENYDNYSTPSRDAAISDGIYVLKNIVSEHGDSNPEMLASWNEELNKVIVTIEEHPLTLNELIYTWENLLYSYDPNVSILDRWGIIPMQSFQK